MNYLNQGKDQKHREVICAKCFGLGGEPAAGNSQLMTPELINVISEHSIGNYRVLYNNCSILLSAAIEKEVHQLDEKLYLECFPASTVKRGRK